MIRIELNPSEAELLREILANHHSEMRLETAHTHRKDFREFLKKRYEFLETFLNRLDKEMATSGRQMVSIDRLRTVEIFQGLSDGDLRVVSQFVQEEQAGEGVTLCREGEPADRLFILEGGTVSIRSQKGEQTEIKETGKILGWSFLVAPNRYTATVATLGSCKLLVIKSPDFYYLIHKEPKLGVNIMDNLAQVVASRLKSAAN